MCDGKLFHMDGRLLFSFPETLTNYAMIPSKCFFFAGGDMYCYTTKVELMCKDCEMLNHSQRYICTKSGTTYRVWSAETCEPCFEFNGPMAKRVSVITNALVVIDEPIQGYQAISVIDFTGKCIRAMVYKGNCVFASPVPCGFLCKGKSGITHGDKVIENCPDASLTLWYEFGTFSVQKNNIVRMYECTNGVELFRMDVEDGFFGFDCGFCIFAKDEMRVYDLLGRCISKYPYKYDEDEIIYYTSPWMRVTTVTRDGKLRVYEV